MPVVIRDFSYATSPRGDPSFAPLTFAFDVASQSAPYYCLHIHNDVALRQGHNEAMQCGDAFQPRMYQERYTGTGDDPRRRNYAYLRNRTEVYHYAYAKRQGYSENPSKVDIRIIRLLQRP